MENQKSLKEFRKDSSLTQEELAKLSGVSIRTVQRLEKGLTTGSPHTIKMLAKTLKIETSQLLLQKSQSSTTDNGLVKARLLNFSILSLLLIPFGNILLPTIIFLRYRKNTIVNQIGKKIISFQIISSFFLFFLSAIIFISMGRGNGAIPIPVFVCYILINSVNIAIVIYTSIQINKKKEAPNFFPNIL